MRRIGLLLKRSEEKAVLLGAKMCHFLKESGKEVLLEESCKELAVAWSANVTETLPDEVDLLVVLGGDGTILRAAALLNAKPTPVLGINLGRVGFMAEVSPDEAISELKSAMAGTALLVKRMLLQITLPDGKTARVLNELVIHWGGIARLIDLGIRPGNSREIELRADGLIVSTPVGSSAYSFAASGPLIHPDVEGILLTPICPYAGLKRPLLIPAHLETEIVLKRGEDLTLTLDGHTTVDLQQNQSIRVVRSQLPFVMVKTKARDYFDVLKEKLGLL
ncbi:MAG: NAD(+)/NADH kinase [Desulfomonile tiedjei]|nr:NAD(+)/NADH kinase [Desulfomonile tiedjei]